MKISIAVCIFLMGLLGYGQTMEEKKAVQQTIATFFEGFHKQDSLILKNTVADDVIFQTIGKNKEGKLMVKNEVFSNFLKSIVSIPKTTKFKERITDYNIQIDGPMANAWTSYEFWVNDNLSHCGVNSFQLFNDGASWRIIYLIDTRRKEGCIQKE